MAVREMKERRGDTEGIKMEMLRLLCCPAATSCREELLLRKTRGTKVK